MNTDEIPVNGDGGGSSAMIAPQAQAADNGKGKGKNGNGEKLPLLSSTSRSSFTAVLEAANDLRKMDEILEDAAAITGGQNGGITAGSAPTLEDIADALSDGEEPMFDHDHESDADDNDNDNNGKPAYTAETVAAISSLMKGEESALFSEDNGSSSSSNNNGNGSKKSPLAKKEITLQDRAAAIISVYHDYILEEQDDHDNNQGDDDDEASAGMVNEVQLLEASRRAEIKVVTLEKFCKDVQVVQSSSDESSGSGDDDDDDDCSDDSDRRVHQHHSLPHPPARRIRPHLRGPTAATTTAAFRLKAEVALKVKAVGQTTAKVAKKAAGAVKTKVNDTMSKSRDVRYQVEAVDMNDYDFQDYEKKMSQETYQDDMEYGLTPTEQMNQEVEDRDYHHNQQHQQQMQYDDTTSDESGSAVYGMHIIDRDTNPTLKRKPRTDDDEEAIGLFNEMCDELGVTPDTHPELVHRFYQRPRSSRYKYPIFRTKKFKQALMYGGALTLLLLVAVAIISAMSNGFEEVRRQKKTNTPLPDWKEDEGWRIKQKLEWEKEHGNGNGNGNGNNDQDNAGSGNDGVADSWETDGVMIATGGDHSGQVVETAGKQSQSKMFQIISESYRPVWYDRSTGWTGVTYDEALSWCDSHDGYTPCPYEVYCPDEDTLLAGVMDKDGESWAPVTNEHNEWVQVGTEGACDLYLTRYGKHPDWGITGEDNEAITRHIMCCREHPIGEASIWEKYEHKAGSEHVARPNGPPSGAMETKPTEGPPPPTTILSTGSKQQHQEDIDLEILFLSMSKKYNPIWFDRDSGWEGQTYQESLNFCAQLDDYIPCPYEVYCPGGHGKLLDGAQDQQESWSAIIDDANDWVRVDEGGLCNLYSETEKELPSWGLSGENNEEITRHIMCCHSAPHIASFSSEGDDMVSSTEEDTAAINNNNNPDMTGPSLVMLPEPIESLTELEAQLMDLHHPTWFNSDLGWKGTTYADAKAFCESIPHVTKDGETLHLCPRDAYCPNGPQASKPLSLQMDPYDGIQWAPINNEDNGWIMVGKFSDDHPLTCQTYLEVNQHEPEWGISGKSPELKQHILCCEDSSGNAVTLPSDGELIDKVVVQLKPKVDPDIDEELVSNSETSTAGNIVSLDMGTSTEQQSSSSSMTKLEMEVQDLLHPSWYSNEFGWQGTTYEDARAFCESIPHGEGTLHMCPLEAYCPNGQQDTEPLYLQMDAFEGVQWAPILNRENGWLMVGDIGGLTCQTYQQINHRDPSWGLDGSSTQLKQHILCCEDNNPGHSSGKIAPSKGGDEKGKLTNTVIGINQDVETDDSSSSGINQGDSKPDSSQADSDSFEDSITDHFNPTWFDSDRGGWEGGSHDDGIQFCEQFAGAHGKRMELCPYAAYCPDGPTEPVMGGYSINFDTEGEQWAPVFGQENHWVMIGKRGHNSATTCLSHMQLTKEEPSWGLDGSKKEVKKHIMCCSPLQ